MTILSHLISGVIKIILNIFPNNIELTIIGLSFIFLFYYTSSLYFYCYNFSNQMIIQNKYKKKLMKHLSQSDNSYLHPGFLSFGSVRNYT